MRTTRSSVIVPVLSVHKMSMAPRFWMADSFLTITFSLASFCAPLARFELTIIGSISGVKPTATAMAKKKALLTSCLVMTLRMKTMGNKMAIIFKRRALTRFRPISKAVSALLPVALFAMSPKKVSFPVFKMRMVP